MTARLSQGSFVLGWDFEAHSPDGPPVHAQPLPVFWWAMFDDSP
jgi:hypothetical protein